MICDNSTSKWMKQMNERTVHWKGYLYSKNVLYGFL
jgi:hypothetical protein